METVDVVGVVAVVVPLPKEMHWPKRKIRRRKMLKKKWIQVEFVAVVEVVGVAAVAWL